MNAHLPNLRESEERPGDEQARLQPLRARSCMAFLAIETRMRELAARDRRKAAKAAGVVAQTWN